MFVQLIKNNSKGGKKEVSDFIKEEGPEERVEELQQSEKKA